MCLHAPGVHVAISSILLGHCCCAGHAAAATSTQATAQRTRGINAGTAQTPTQRGKGKRVRKAPEVYTPMPTPLVAAAGNRQRATGKRKAAAADSDGAQDAWGHVSMADKGLVLLSSLTAEEHTSVPSGGDSCFW